MFLVLIKTKEYPVKNQFLFVSLLSIVISGCGESHPPEINTKTASLDELKTYQELHCMDKFKMHPFCLDVQNEKSSKTDASMRRKPGAIASFGTPEEAFGKKSRP